MDHPEPPPEPRKTPASHEPARAPWQPDAARAPWQPDAPPDSGEVAVTAQGDDAAYLLLEEARLRCESLQRLPSGPTSALDPVHRELGLAGFYAGAELRPWTRHGLLVLASDRSERVMADPQERLLALFVTTMSAETAVDAQLTGSPARDHVHLAHMHLLSAQKLLTLVLISNPAVFEGV